MPHVTSRQSAGDKITSGTKAYWTLIKIDIRLTFRRKVVMFFNYLMPLTFFFIFAQVYHGVILQVVTMVTVLGILGNGLFGAGIRAAQDREANILRRSRRFRYWWHRR